MNKKIVGSGLLVAILFVSVIGGTVYYFDGILNDSNSKINSLNNQITNLNNEITNLTSQISNLTAQVSLLPNMARTNRNLITSNLNVVEGSYRKVWNWTITFDLKNTGNTPITINNLVINGQPYNNISPVPSINPSIKTGYTLSPLQSATMSVKVINQPIALYQGTNSLYILTTLGDSLEVYLGT